jgi:hypothetical protein
VHPTTTEELAGVRRLVTSLADHPDLPDDVAADLVTAGRVLRRLERSAPLVLPWLNADNAGNAAVLADVLADLPAALAGDVESTLEAEAEAEAETDPSDLGQAESRNERLRLLLAQAVVASNGQPRGDRVRRLIAARLAASLDDRPW